MAAAGGEPRREAAANRPGAVAFVSAVMGDQVRCVSCDALLSGPYCSRRCCISPSGGSGAAIALATL